MNAQNFFPILEGTLSRKALDALMIALAVLFFAAANPLRSVYAASGSPDLIPCSSQPICGYLQAHAADSAVTAPPDCSGYAACDYLKAHNAGVEASLAEMLAGLPGPNASEPQLEVAQSTLVRSGPGVDSYSYGTLPHHFVSRIIGVSAEGTWWVIPLPQAVSPDGYGWVDADAVKARNVTTSALDTPGCDLLSVCGYIKAHSTDSLASAQQSCADAAICAFLQSHLTIFQPSYAVERLMGSPAIALTGK